MHYCSMIGNNALRITTSPYVLQNDLNAGETIPVNWQGWLAPVRLNERYCFTIVAVPDILSETTFTR